MDFELSDDQQALADAAGSLLDGKASSEQVRAHLASGEGYDAKLWRAMAEQGWMGIGLAAERGGLGLGFVEVAVLLEAAGRHVAPVPLLPSLLALDALAASESAAAEPWVGPLATGEAIGCVAWTVDPAGVVAEPGGAGSPGSAAGSGGSEAGLFLSGRTGPVVGAPIADVAVVWAPQAVYAVDLAAAGRPPAQPAMDGTQSLGWLDLAATPAVPIGGPDAADRLLDAAAVASSAELLGGAARVLQLAADYAKVRVQFGKPIGSFQAVKHRCADMVVDVEGMRSSTWYGAWCLAAADPERSLAASGAKVWCADAAKRVMSSGLQVHGGIGFTWEHDLHLFLKRSQLDQVSFGDATYHRERLAGLLRQRVEAGQPVI